MCKILNPATGRLFTMHLVFPVRIVPADTFEKKDPMDRDYKVVSREDNVRGGDKCDPLNWLIAKEESEDSEETVEEKEVEEKEEDFTDWMYEAAMQEALGNLRVSEPRFCGSSKSTLTLPVRPKDRYDAMWADFRRRADNAKRHRLNQRPSKLGRMLASDLQGVPL